MFFLAAHFYEALRHDFSEFGDDENFRARARGNFDRLALVVPVARCGEDKVHFALFVEIDLVGKIPVSLDPGIDEDHLPGRRDETEVPIPKKLYWGPLKTV